MSLGGLPAQGARKSSAVPSAGGFLLLGGDAYALGVDGFLQEIDLAETLVRHRLEALDLAPHEVGDACRWLPWDRRAKRARLLQRGGAESSAVLDRTHEAILPRVCDSGMTERQRVAACTAARSP